MELKVNAYGKINLYLDVKEKLPNGYHEIESIMQDVGLNDEITIRAGRKANADTEIVLKSNTKSMPLDSSNLAIKGANEVLKNYAGEFNYFEIEIEKNLPIAAGLAGGTADGAAVMLGINRIIGYKYSLDELIEMGKKMGSDFPFSISMNCYKNKEVLEGMIGIENAVLSSIIRGTGDKMVKIDSLPAYVILLNPGIFVSTKEVYEGLDKIEKKQELNINHLIESIQNKDYKEALNNIDNVMEEYTLKEYNKVRELKNWALVNIGPKKALMSGSGPTIALYYLDYKDAIDDFNSIDIDVQKYITNTGIK